MAEVGGAIGAQHPRALPEETHGGLGSDVVFRNRRPETGPARARIELLLRAEQRVAAADATVNSLLRSDFPITAGVSEFGSGVTGDRERLAVELLAPFGLGFH